MVIINNTQQRYSIEVQTAIRDELEKEKKKKRQEKIKKIKKNNRRGEGEVNIANNTINNVAKQRN